MKKSKLGTYYTLPIALWLIVFFAIPMAIVLAYAFLKKGTYGGVEMELSLASFYIFTDKVFLTTLFKTVYISIMVTIFTVLLSIPTAYYMARSKYKKELLFLVIIPFWTNFLIRIYAWIAVLGNNGFLNNILLKLGIIDTPLQLLYNTGAVILISVYTSLPFAILPLYAVIEKFDFSLIEAARDLGATNREAFFKIFIPNIKPGIITAVLFTFIPALGSYAVPKLVGGTQATMLGNIIAQHLTVTRNWPLASTISAALIIVTSIAILLFMKLSNKETKLEVVAEDE
ncbi:Spermidine/putrescine transport system permease protein PotB [Fusobacterium necrogenes]|uniref:Spermidine/putrescine transport system permease protein PotB n=1 Tax=Fusobacterium necrogenes TaxID=858 RepID=A0A377GWX8_9FUSO|nr:Spermidine/putrescine transport system permease protein PotB [Fusobacterium necrogenes]